MTPATTGWHVAEGAHRSMFASLRHQKSGIEDQIFYSSLLLQPTLSSIWYPYALL
jgi:hypothetical protein